MRDQRDISEKLKHDSIHFVVVVVVVYCQTHDGLFLWIEVHRLHAYTCQLSRLKRGSHALGSKTSTLRLLAPIARDKSLSHPDEH